MADVAKAKKLLDKLSNGGDVSMRDLDGALGKEGVADYEGRWQYELENRKIFEVKPEQIKHYEELVHKGDFDYSRAESVSKPSKRSKRINGKSSAQRLEELSETKYERAIEYLAEIISIDGSLRIWFDRDLDFGAGTTTLSINPDGIPRTVTSRSTHRLGDGMATKRSKADVKKDVLEAAIEWAERAKALGKDGALGAVGELGAEEAAILKAKLAALKGGM
jgi:hypothetical protein